MLIGAFSVFLVTKQPVSNIIGIITIVLPAAGYGSRAPGLTGPRTRVSGNRVPQPDRVFPGGPHCLRDPAPRAGWASLRHRLAIARTDRRASRYSVGTRHRRDGVDVLSAQEGWAVRVRRFLWGSAGLSEAS